MKLTLTKNLAPARVAAKAKVDGDAEFVRSQFITTGSGQAMVYQAKQAEAQVYLQAGVVGPLMTAEIGLTAPDADALATLWASMGQQWQVVAAAIEVKRLTAKAAIDAAGSPAAIEAASVVDWTL